MLAAFNATATAKLELGGLDLPQVMSNLERALVEPEQG